MYDPTPTFVVVNALKNVEDEFQLITVIYINTLNIISITPIDEEQNIFSLSFSESIRLYQFNSIDKGNFLVKDLIVQIEEDNLMHFNRIFEI